MSETGNGEEQDPIIGHLPRVEKKLDLLRDEVRARLALQKIELLEELSDIIKAEIGGAKFGLRMELDRIGARLSALEEGRAPRARSSGAGRSASRG